MIQGILKKQGEPNGYIVGREAGGAIAVGLRYGSGTLYHKVEGQMPVYWTGPSIGFDLGANAGSTFVLVYNLNDTDQLYKRYPAGEGDAYVVGGLTASYLRKGNVVLIPIRVGAGLRLGVNAGYMKFSQEAALAAVLGRASRSTFPVAVQRSRRQSRGHARQTRTTTARRAARADQAARRGPARRQDRSRRRAYTAPGRAPRRYSARSRRPSRSWSMSRTPRPTSAPKATWASSTR